jgi:zinc protease
MGRLGDLMVKMNSPSVLLLSFIFATIGGGANAKSHQILPAGAATQSLKNGLDVILLPLDTPGLVSVQTWMEVGSGDEVEPGSTGFAHFFEHLMFHGTPALSGKARELRLLELGFEENAWTSQDATNYHLLGSVDGLGEVLEIEADRFSHLTLNAEGVRREAGAVYGEFRKGLAYPENAINKTLWGLAFTRHPYSHDTIGIEADVAAMPNELERARTFFRTHYRPDRALLVLSGDLPMETIMAQVEQTYGRWELGDRPAAATITVEPRQRSERREILRWNGAPTSDRLVMGWRVPGERQAPGQVVNNALLASLIGSKTSGLYQGLVVRERVAHDLSTNAWGGTDEPGLFEVWVTLTSPGSHGVAGAAIDQAVIDLQGLTPEVFAAAKGKLLRKWKLALAGPESWGSMIGSYAQILGSMDGVEQALTALDEVTLDDFKQFVATHLVKSQRTTIVFVGGSE